MACLPADVGNRVSLQMAAVSEINASWPPKEWAIELLPGANPRVLRPSECVTYGQALKGYKEVGGSRPLQVGKTYGFAILGAGPTGSRADGRRVGIFCVQQRADGRHAYLPYVDHPDGTTTYPACGRYLGNPPAADGIVPADTPRP